MKYFNKGFFRAALGFLVIIAVSLLVLTAVSAYAVGVSKIGFTTDEQSIKPNTLSGPLTIQTQDSGGSSVQTPETIDLEFLSTSPTGEFLGSNGNPVTTTMSKNTANRTFYYRDSGEGSFTITINATGRDTGEKWATNQKINVFSSAIPNTSGNNNNGEILGESTTSDSEPSATSGSMLPTYATVSSQLEVTAGGDRLTSPGSPISFQALIKKNSVANSSLTFSWSFGDGNVGEGALVTHMYQYPGDYAVVLNVRSGNTFAVSRLKVKVVEPQISVNQKDGYLEIVNNGNSEVNVFNWKVTSGTHSFIFQPDTIILAHSSIRLPNSLLKMKSSSDEGVVLRNFLGDKVFSASSPNMNNKIALTEIMPKPSPVKSVVAAKSVGAVLGEATTSEASISTTSEEMVYEVPESKGFIGRAWQFLIGMVH